MEFWSNNERAAVTHPIVDALDTPEEMLREAIHQRKPIGPIIQELLENERVEIASNALFRAFALVQRSRRSRWPLVIDMIRFASGIAARCGQTMPGLAKRNRVEKQAFQQGVERIRTHLGLRKTNTMQSEVARDRMRRRNCRHQKHD